MPQNAVFRSDLAHQTHAKFLYPHYVRSLGKPSQSALTDQLIQTSVLFTLVIKPS